MLMHIRSHPQQIFSNRGSDKNILKNPDFNADEFDADMLQLLQAAINSGHLQAINMHMDGEGTPNLEFLRGPWKRC
jgi:hypothetical protein